VEVKRITAGNPQLGLSQEIQGILKPDGMFQTRRILLRIKAIGKNS